MRLLRRILVYQEKNERKNEMNKKCPHCGSSKTAPILYGYPILNEETKQALDEKKLYLGGCCVCGIEPEFHCFDCKKDFGTPPVFVCKNETEKYRDIIVSISFYDGGYFEGYPEVFMEKRIDSIMVSVYAGHRKEPVFQRTMSENEWFMIIDQLYETLYIHEWE